MKKQTKIVAAALMLAATIVMVTTVSFAYLTVSKAPAVQGIQVTIAGSHTVLVAPDVAYTQDGRVLHYPGKFTDTMNFSNYSQYDYLQETAGLLPVSTADGENWYIPTYYEEDAPEVALGEAFTGQIKPTREFLLDNKLQYANMTPQQLKDSPQGHYVYLDFWVVAPVEHYQLRVSTDTKSAGSFVVPLPKPQQTQIDGETSFALTDINAQTSAAVRIGFLTNEDILIDDSLLAYSRSADYNSNYRQIQGEYTEAGTEALESDNSRFVIYEPNADLHPVQVSDARGVAVQNGQYALTEPLGKGGVPVAVSDRVTVQLANSWTVAGEQTMIAQQFSAFMAGRDITGQTAQSLSRQFFQERLQYQVFPYVTKGRFISNTQNLYAIAAQDKLAQSEELAQLSQSGATEDVYLTQLRSNVPQRIRMYIWLEGQDVDCVNLAATGGFVVSIELAGSNQP